jgi:chemotaxis protein MotB
MRKIQVVLSLALIVAIGFVGCVPQRKFAEVKSAKDESDAENKELQRKLDNISATTKEQGTTIETLKKSVSKLNEDTLLYGKEYRRLRVMYDKVNDLNNELLSKNEKLLNSSLDENRKLLRDLEKAKEALQVKEDSLYKLEKSVKEKQAALAKAQKDLFDREIKIKELDSLLQAQRSASELLKAKLEAALLNYKNKGITVREENGKVYVSMEAQLLFPSGKTDINPDGKAAIIQLAKIIQDEKDLNITVEGHTDTDKINSAGLIPRDNWELSVLRSTEVIKLITANSTIDPAQLSASGRSEYHPLDAEDKARNRRIEIILEPNLKELYNIIK